MNCTNKRNGERISLLSGFTACITVGNSIVNATLRDISSAGLSVCEVKTKFMRASHQYNIAVHGYGYSSLLPIKPRWVGISNCGEFLQIGFKILYIPRSWKLFLEKNTSCPVHNKETLMIS